MIPPPVHDQSQVADVGALGTHQAPRPAQRRPRRPVDRHNDGTGSAGRTSHLHIELSERAQARRRVPEPGGVIHGHPGTDPGTDDLAKTHRGPLTCGLSVEVLRRYSNRSDLVKIMTDVLRRIDENDQDDEPGVYSTGMGSGKTTPIRERWGETDLQGMVDSFLTGATVPELVTKYGISKSSVKRVLRQHGAYRHIQQPATRVSQSTRKK